MVDCRAAADNLTRWGPRFLPMLLCSAAHDHIQEDPVPSFDVVSEIDMQEVKNALQQAQREVGQRFDFKGTDASLEQNDDGIVIRANSEGRVDGARDVLETKMLRRSVPLLALDKQDIKPAGGKMHQQLIKLKQGVDKDAAKAIVKSLKESKLKIQGSIQGDTVRVTGKKRDDLQSAIAYLKEQDFGLPLQYKNFRD